MNYITETQIIIFSSTWKNPVTTILTKNVFRAKPLCDDLLWLKLIGTHFSDVLIKKQNKNGFENVAWNPTAI